MQNALSSGRTNKLDETSHQFMSSPQDDEAQLDNSLDAAVMMLTREDASMLVNDDSDKKLAPHLSGQAINVDQSGFSSIRVPAKSSSSNFLV